MNNADFAALLNQPSSASSSATTARASKRGPTAGNNSGGAHQPKKRPRPAKPESDSAKYRDRASERRTDSNPDYADAINQHVVVDVEQSKFLGGDEEHTHLVKGLDLALLRKVRSTLGSLRAQSTAAASSPEAGRLSAAEGGVAAAHTAGAAAVTTVSASTAGGELHSHTLLGRAVIAQMLSHREPADAAPAARSVVAASRTLFVFDVAPHTAEVIPTTVTRSRDQDIEDGDDEGSMVHSGISQQLLDRIGGVLRVGLRHDRGKARSSSEAKAPAVGASATGAADPGAVVDMFA